jgi:hypothetical protein
MNDEPTEEGLRRYPEPPRGHYCANEVPGPVCTCKPTCENLCNGVCGCEACRHAYGDFLSTE